MSNFSRALVLVAPTLVALCFPCAPTYAAADADMTASRAYVLAVETMERLPQPERLRFKTQVQATGVNIALIEGRGSTAGYAGFELGWGGGMRPATTWAGFHRHDGDRTVLMKDDRALIVTSPMYDPSWDGAHDWLRYGFSGSTVSKFPTPAPTPTATPDSGSLRVIGGVRALNSGDYAVHDAPMASCPDGTPGRHLRLTARTDAEQHPLTDVIVDGQSRFCSMRFNIGQASLVSLTGDFELHFGSVGQYWLTTNGTARFLFRMFGVGAKRATITFGYTDFAFPSSDNDIPVPEQRAGVPSSTKH